MQEEQNSAPSAAKSGVTHSKMQLFLSDWSVPWAPGGAVELFLRVCIFKSLISQGFWLETRMMVRRFSKGYLKNNC